MAYLCIEQKITGFTKLTDMGGNGEFSTKNYGYGWVWVWLNGMEWSVSQNFAPRRALNRMYAKFHVSSCYGF